MLFIILKHLTSRCPKPVVYIESTLCLEVLKYVDKLMNQNLL